MSKSEQKSQEPYLILEATTSDKLQPKVIEALENGYQLYGILCTQGGNLLQAMVLPEPDKNLLENMKDKKK